MAKPGRQLWLLAVFFAAVGVGVGVLYQRLRAGSIQAAEGRLEYEAGRFDLASAAYQRATQSDPKNADAWFWLGMSRKNQGLSASAADALAKATALKPGRAPWWFEYAQACQWAADRFGEAQRAWEEVIRLLPEGDPRVLHAQINLARALGAQKQIDQAIQKLQTLLARQENREVRFALAEVLAWGGRFEESVEQYHRALTSSSEK